MNISYLHCSLQDPGSGSALEVFTDQPGMQLYTGNFLDGSYSGRDGEPIAKHCGVCLETQAWPNAINIEVSHCHNTSLRWRFRLAIMK